MQEPRPVPELLEELLVFATAVSNVLAAPELDWQKRPNTNEWSLTELVCHLRDVEIEVHQARFRALIAMDNAFLPGVTADEWVGPRQYQLQNGRSALATFLAARQETTTLLGQLDEALWQRKGRHAFFGPTSMHELLNLVVKHDEAHLAQIVALVN